MVTNPVTTQHRRLTNLLSMWVCGFITAFKSLLLRPENRRNIVGFRVFHFLTILKPFETIDLF